jgi:hypothetical protein
MSMLECYDVPHENTLVPRTGPRALGNNVQATSSSPVPARTPIVACDIPSPTLSWHVIVRTSLNQLDGVVLAFVAGLSV